MENKLFVLSERVSIANHFLAELRDKSHQRDRMRFRRNMERLGEIMAYEISRSLTYAASTVETPLAGIGIPLMRESPVLVTIMRAGIPFHQGLLNYFDHADSGFIGAYRHEQEDDVTVRIDYASLPPVEGKNVILIDPMLATGKSVLDAKKIIVKKGTPAHLFVVSVVAAPEGVRMLKDNLDIPHSLWTCALDEKLNSRFYIVPGLGDAGDLSYGPRE